MVCVMHLNAHEVALESALMVRRGITLQVQVSVCVKRKMSRMPSVLVTKKSEAKSTQSKGDKRKKRKPPDDGYINDTPSPFPVALAIDDAKDSQVIWPIHCKNSQPFFVGKLNRNECTVDIYDPPSAECLHRMGFFGKSCLIRQNLYQLRPMKQPANETVAIEAQGETNRSSVKRTDNLLQYKFGCKKLSDSPFGVKQKQWYSLYRAFSGTIPTKEHIVKGLYGSSVTSDSNAATLSIACGFDTASYLYCEMDGTSNDHTFSDTSSDNDSRNDDFSLDSDKLLQATGSEVLKLTLEEAFFLSYGLSVLNVYDDTDDETAKPMNLENMWKVFNEIYDTNDRTRFLAFYSAYHYFRSRGKYPVPLHAFSNSHSI